MSPWNEALGQLIWHYYYFSIGLKASLILYYAIYYSYKIMIKEYLIYTALASYPGLPSNSYATVHAYAELVELTITHTRGR